MKKNIAMRMIISFVELTEILVNLFGTKKDGTPANGCVMCSATWFKDTDSFNGDLVAVKLNGVGRPLKVNNPYYNRLQAIKVGNNIQFGYSYESGVNNHLAKQGEEKTFESGKLTWGHWYNYNGIEQVNKIIEHNDNLYIRLYHCKNTAIDTIYFLDGKRVTDKNIIADIESHIKERDWNIKTQENAGLAPEEQVHPFAVKYANLKHISIGGGRYTLL